MSVGNNFPLSNIEMESYDADDELCDREVQFYMKDEIRRDTCICRKYRNLSIPSKKCPVCQDDLSSKVMNADASAYKKSRTDSSHTYNQKYAQAKNTYHGSKVTKTAGNRQNRKRKPKVIPATEYIAKYYFSHLMKYENLTLPSRMQENKQLENSDRESLDLSTTFTRQSVAASSVLVASTQITDGMLANELSRLFIQNKQ